MLNWRKICKFALPQKPSLFGTVTVFQGKCRTFLNKLHVQDIQCSVILKNTPGRNMTGVCDCFLSNSLEPLCSPAVKAGVLIQQCFSKAHRGGCFPAGSFTANSHNHSSHLAVVDTLALQYANWAFAEQGLPHLLQCWGYTRSSDWWLLCLLKHTPLEWLSSARAVVRTGCMVQWSPNPCSMQKVSGLVLSISNLEGSGRKWSERLWWAAASKQYWGQLTNDITYFMAASPKVAILKSGIY